MSQSIINDSSSTSSSSSSTKSSSSSTKGSSSSTKKSGVEEDDDDEIGGIDVNTGNHERYVADPAKKRVKKAYDFDSEDNDIIPKKRDALDELLDSEDEGVGEFVRKPAEIFLEDGVLVDRPVTEKPKKAKEKD